MTIAYATPAPRVLVPISTLRRNRATYICQHCGMPTCPDRRVDGPNGTQFISTCCGRLNTQAAPGRR